jgi:uncharacterized protein
MHTTDPVRLSRWVHVFRDQADAIALFHALEIDVSYLPPELGPMLDLLKIGTTPEFLARQGYGDISDVMVELQERGFIVPVCTDDLALLDAKRAVAMPAQGLETLYLLLTDHCNLRCGYCLIHNCMPEGYQREHMSWETAKTAVDLFFANLARNPLSMKNSRKMIFFYGGEPLLNFEVLRQVVLYVEDVYRAELADMGEGFVFSLITNGTLVDEKIAAFLAAHPRVSISVSLDGPQEMNDQKRRYIDGRGSFEHIARGLRVLRAAGCGNISLSSTVDVHNIDRLEEVLALSDEFGLIAISLNPLLDTEQGKVDEAYLQKVNTRLIEYFVRARQKGVYEERMMRKVKPFMSHRVRPYDCQATGSQVVCSPDGQLGICQEGLGMKDYFFGAATPEFDFHSHPVAQEWGRRSPLNMPQCYDCPALGICGGGCAYGAYLRHGSIWSVDTRFCQHSLTALRWVVWDIYEQMAA